MWKIMNEPLLYFDSEKVHDHFTQIGNFKSTLSAIKNRKANQKVKVAVTQMTFSRLPEIIPFALAYAKSPSPTIPEFDVAGAKKLFPDFTDYLKQINMLLADSPVSLAETDPDLVEILQGFDKKATPGTRPNLLRLLGALADDVFLGPHTFHLDISNRCNTNCVFCGLHSPMLLAPKKKIRGRRFTENWKGRILDKEIFTRLVDDLNEIGCKEDILFSGEGEPLTHPDAMDMISYVKSKDMSLTLFTNGLKVDDPMSSLFVNSGLDILYWSLSAATPKTFSTLQPVRKPEDHGKMIEQMKRLVEKKRKKDNRPFIILAHVINNQNYHECEKAMGIARYVGVDSVRFQVMHSCSSTESLLINKEQFKIASQQVERARLEGEKARIEMVANIDFQLEAAAKTYELPETVLPCHWSHDLYNKTGCLAGWFFSRSFTDGRISFCCHDKIVGNLYRASYKDIWRSKKYGDIRRRAKAFDMNHNIDLSDESCGGMLLDKDCDYCGNYEFINKALNDLSDLGWDKFLRRSG